MKRRILCAISMGLAILYGISLLFAACGQTQPDASAQTSDSSSAAGMTMEYEDRIFDNSYVHTIDIQISEDDWEDLKLNALYKEAYDCTVIIDGETFHHVGVRTKGNVTLIQSIVREWDRYSLVLDFGAFQPSQRYYGLDKLSLNNNICDSSFIRDYLCYDMMASMGVPAPLISFTVVSVNGEPLGLYTTVEGMDESYALRNFGTTYGNLYKPEHMNIAGMLTGEVKDCTLNVGALAGGEGSVDAAAFMGVSDTTVGLKYQGDDLSLYSQIWDNAVFKLGTSDKHRLVNIIRTFNEGEDVEAVLDADMLLRFFAVGSFVLNDDCYTSYAGHNYGLYEKDGRIMMLPWDYDHSLGCTGAAAGTTSWTEYINLPMDEPVIGVDLADRPLLNCLLTDEAYLARYHGYIDQFLTDYVESGRLESATADITALIAPYVAQDTVSGVTVEAFETAVQSDLEFCRLRAQSLRGQLNGTIPATKAGQTEAPEALIDCEHFISPDSGSLTELLIPEGSGLYFEDFIDSIVRRINAFATVSVLPIEDIIRLLPWSNDPEGSFVDRMIASGKVQDEEKLHSAIKWLIIRFVRDSVFYVLGAVVLIAGFIFVFRYGKNRQPAARKGGTRHV